MNNDLISRQEAIDAIGEKPLAWVQSEYEEGLQTQWESDIEAIKALPPAQPEQPLDIQDILDYLDTVLHPIISPEHWNVYSELHDMISDLRFAQPEQRWIPISERLPEEKKDVLITFKHNMAVGFWEDILGDGDPAWYAYSGDGWITDTDTVDSDGIPIAWMPLPEFCSEKRK